MSLVKGTFIDKTVPIQSSSDPVENDDLARKSYVDGAAAAAAAAAVESGPTQVLFGSPDGLTIDHSEFLTYDASIGLFVNEGGEQQMRPLGNDPAGPFGIVKNDLIKVEGNPGDGIALTRLQRDVIQAKKDTATAQYDASLGWDGVDSWMGVSKTENAGNNISMIKLFPDKAQLFTVDIAGGLGPQPVLPAQDYDLTVKKYVDDLLAGKQDSLGTGTTSEFLRGDLTWQEISTAPDVLLVPDFASLPSPGDEVVLYGTQDDNKLWRWGQIGTPLVPDWTVGATGDFATLADALASASVVNGNVIEVQAGTYAVASTLVINKEVLIVGAGIGQTILQTAGTSGDPVTMISVTANNVLLKGMTIQHRKTSNTSVECAVSVSAGAFPTFTYVYGFIMDSCRVEYAEFGVVIRGEDFKIANNQLAYTTGTVSNSNRAIGIYGSYGQCHIVNNVIDNSALNGTGCRAIYSTSTNNTSNEFCQGQLVIADNTHLGLLQQFYLQDNVRGNPGEYELFFLNNITNETSLFAGIFLSTANQADLFAQVVVENNSISNNHETATGFGKGLFAIDGTGSSLAYRSSPLPVHSLNNTLAQLTFRSDYSEATGSSGSVVGYKNTVFAPVTVAFDNDIPEAPPTPATPGESVGGYEEMSPMLIDDAIDDGVTDRAPSQNAVYDALALKQNSLGTGTTSDYLRGDLTWQVLPSVPASKKEIVTLSETDITNGYIDCDFLAVADSMRLVTGGVEQMETESYTLSTVGGVTRITFAGNLISPAPSALEAGDKVYLQYLK